MPKPGHEINCLRFVALQESAKKTFLLHFFAKDFRPYAFICTYKDVSEYVLISDKVIKV